MPLNQSILSGLEHEITVTRKILERIPTEKFDWKPHERSATMGFLATHIATLPKLAISSITTESFDFAPEGEIIDKIETLKSTTELVETFDSLISDFKTKLSNLDDDYLKKDWSLCFSGKTLFTSPRTDVLESVFIRHLIHHRGQLTVYMRLNEIPVPAVYGPSADENIF